MNSNGPWFWNAAGFITLSDPACRTAFARERALRLKQPSDYFRFKMVVSAPLPHVRACRLGTRKLRTDLAMSARKFFFAFLLSPDSCLEPL
jgi:hypothetical protein